VGDADALWITRATGGIRSCMSGSPILNHRTQVIGTVSVRTAFGDTALDIHKPGGVQTENGPNPALRACLPGWILRGLKTGRAIANDGQSASARQAE
jgi:hypothetical protein